MDNLAYYLEQGFLELRIPPNPTDLTLSKRINQDQTMLVININ